MNAEIDSSPANHGSKKQGLNLPHCIVIIPAHNEARDIGQVIN